MESCFHGHPELGISFINSTFDFMVSSLKILFQNNVTGETQWYTKLIDLIDKQQIAPIWMSEAKV